MVTSDHKLARKTLTFGIRNGLRIGMIFCWATFLLTLFGCGEGKSRVKSPAEKSFDAANSLIISKSKGIAQGNTVRAQKRGADFSDALEKLQKVAFTGGKNSPRVSLTGEKFLVYCQEVDDGVCFLVHVPQLKNYKNEVRMALANLAWATATSVSEDLHKERPIRIGVGLRGSALYGAIATGSSNGEPKIEQGFSVSTEPLIPFFAAKSAVENSSGATSGQMRKAD